MSSVHEDPSQPIHSFQPRAGVGGRTNEKAQNWSLECLNFSRNSRCQNQLQLSLHFRAVPGATRPGAPKGLQSVSFQLPRCKATRTFLQRCPQLEGTEDSDRADTAKGLLALQSRPDGSRQQPNGRVWWMPEKCQPTHHVSQARSKPELRPGARVLGNAVSIPWKLTKCSVKACPVPRRTEPATEVFMPINTSGLAEQPLHRLCPTPASTSPGIQ